MQPAQSLIQVGSGCCLMLPLIGLRATAAEPVVDLYAPLLSEEALPYPAVGFDEVSHNVSSYQASTSVWSSVKPSAKTANTLPGKLQSAVAARHSDALLQSHPVVLNLQAYEVDAPFPAEEVLQMPIPLASEMETASNLLETNAIEADAANHKTTIPDVISSDLHVPPVFEATAVNNIAMGALHVDLKIANEEEGIATLVKGSENGRQAVDFGEWLLPFDDVNKILGFTAAVQTDGRIELRSSEVITYIQLASLPIDPDLGKVWSIRDIENHLGASAEFNREHYAIHFNRAALNRSISAPTVIEQALGQSSEQDAYMASLLSSSSQQESQNLKQHESIPNIPRAAVQLSLDLEQSGESLSSSLLRPTTSLSVAPPTPSENGSDSISTVNSEFGLLLVGLAINEMTTVEATLVRGRQNADGAVNFDQWLIPFDDAMTALGISTVVQPDGQLLLESPGIATLLDLDSLDSDPDLGPVLSVTDIQERFAIPADFSLSEYAINFYPPALDSLPARLDFRGQERPVVLEGLTLLEPTGVNITGVRQAVRVNASEGKVDTPVGQVSALGNVLGGSWYARLEQPSVTDYRTWQLRELQYLRQSDNSDFAIGSQPIFWQNFSTNRNRSSDFWGVSTTQRWGFTPNVSDSESGFNPSRRRQSEAIGRTVSGEAAPGTLVQLTQGLNGPIVDERIVNSSGLYRFDNVPAKNGLSQYYSERGYQVQLYANGLRTGIPETRSAVFTSLPGQLPQGAGTLIASVGAQQQRQPRQILGRFNQLQGGIAYRQGVTESLTLGTGLIQEGTTQALVEAFYLPESVPLQAAFSAAVELGTGDTQLNADIRYRPAQNVRLALLSDRFSQRVNASWKLSPYFSMTARGNTRDRSLSLGAQANYRADKWSATANASLDTRRNFRWALNAQNKHLSIANRGNEISTYSEIVYRLSRLTEDNTYVSSNHEWLLNYETRGVQQGSFSGFPTGQLATFQWRYRAPYQLSNSYQPWNFSLGYGVGSRGSGPLASVSAALSEGLDLEMQYQSVSTFSDSDSFRFSLVSRLRPRRSATNRLSWAPRHQNRLRTQGGVLVQPFFDNNGNGQRDLEEPLYLEDPDLLFQINHEPVNARRIETYSDGILLMLPPATYRLDLDLAGMPLERTAPSTAYSIHVESGHYTTIAVPMSLTYTVSGVVTDSIGEAVTGIRVEAVGANGHRQVSITNGAGVYYLERLQPETYDLKVDGVLLENHSLFLEGETNTFQEREIHLL